MESRVPEQRQRAQPVRPLQVLPAVRQRVPQQKRRVQQASAPLQSVELQLPDAPAKRERQEP
jgi:hypothetical protein